MLVNKNTKICGLTFFVTTNTNILRSHFYLDNYKDIWPYQKLGSIKTNRIIWTDIYK